MVVGPHIITATVYDTDNSTKKSSAKVYVRNCTRKTSSSVETTNSNGVAIIDLANLPLASGQTVQYATGDVILIVAYDNANKLGGCHDCERYIVAGASKSSSLYLNPIPYTGGVSTVRLLDLLAANTHGSTGYWTEAYALDDGQLLCHMEVPAGQSFNAFSGHNYGKGCSGGFVVVRENNSVMVTATYK